MPLHVTTELALRLEGAELAAAEAGAASSANQAEKAVIGGGLAIFLGVGSPLSQSLHMGMRGPVGADEIDRVEAFFVARRSPVVISLCPHADRTLVDVLAGRGYRITHFENTLVRPLRAEDWFAVEAGIRVAGPNERGAFCETVTRGFTDDGPCPPDLIEIARNLFDAGEAVSYLAWHEEEPVAGAILRAGNGVGLLYCDSTIARMRGTGLQTRLIRARLRKAAESGCDIAMACTLPGTSSQRNYERAGFQVAYTKAMLVKDWT